jgi:cobaltochelatase CobN subunit (EC 6.6.1.2)
VDLVSQVRSSADYAFSDLDHYYEFFGGPARSVETLRGAKPAMLVTDSSTNIIYTDEAKKAIEIGVRTRLLNPEYIEEMLKHSVHGAQHIGKRVENLIGLAATTGRVDNWIFDAVKQTYFGDQEIYNRLKKNNQFATADIIMRLLEAKRRGYWEAEEEDIEELKEKYLALEGDIEDFQNRKREIRCRLKD